MATTDHPRHARRSERGTHRKRRDDVPGAQPVRLKSKPISIRGYAACVLAVMALFFGPPFYEIATADPVASFVLAEQDPAEPGGGLRAHVSPKGVSTAAIGFTGSGYYNAGGQQRFDWSDGVDGFSAKTTIIKPYVQTRKAPELSDHSLFEIALGDSANSAEFGFAVEPNYLDYKVRLFASSWTNGNWNGCYGETNERGDTCGWIDKTPDNSADDIGADLTSAVGSIKSFKILREVASCGEEASSEHFQFYYDGALIGCLQNYVFARSNGFGQVVNAQVFWEVFYGGVKKPCTDMGSSQTYISNLTLYGTKVKPSFSLINTDPAAYSAVKKNGHTFVGGGGGYDVNGVASGKVGGC